MLNQKIGFEEPLKSSLTDRVKFYRRLELTSHTRLDIAYQSLSGCWGEVTKLSAKYNISRKFVYLQRRKLLECLESVFGIGIASAKPICDARLVLSWILQFRLVGRNNLYAIRALLQSLSPELPSSIGFISESLQCVGQALGNQIAWQGTCVFASDELFVSEHQPILVTVDVYSGAILRLDLHANPSPVHWETHWKGLEAAGIRPLKVISDDGALLQAGRKKTLEAIRFQPDTFHAVSHRLGVFLKRLGVQAESAMRTEYEREARFATAQTEPTLNKALQQWQQARPLAQHAVQAYEDFRFLYHIILEQFNVLTPEGVLRQRQFAEQEVQIAIWGLQTLEIKGLPEALAPLIKALPLLFDFLQTAQQGIQQLEKWVDFAALPYWIQAWFHQKNAAKIKGSYRIQQKKVLRSKEFLDFLRLFYKNSTEAQFAQLQQAIFKDLDIACSQASSAVENVNSFIRPFLDQARGQIQQHTLQLIMFYYNHRPFERGKRKGFAPIELLSGKRLDKGWLELLMEEL